MKQWLKRQSTRKGLSLLTLVTLSYSIFAPTAEARLIFSTEDDGTESDTYTLDVEGGNADGANVDLGITFGGALSTPGSLIYNDSTGEFTFNKAVDFGGNEIQDFRVEKLPTASAPTCAAAGDAGRMYYDTDTNEMMVCTGTVWNSVEDLDGALTDGNIFVGNASNQATGVTMSGDVTISNTGVTTIGANAIGSAEVSNNTLTADDLATDSVGADEIAANAVGSAEIATNAVGDDEIDYTNVTLSDFTNDLSLTSANIFVGDGSNQAAGVALSGDATISNTGVLTIGANAIGSAEVSNNTLTADDLATDSVNADEIAAGAVGTSELNATGAGNDKRLTTNGTGDMVWIDDNALDNTLTSANIFVGNGSNQAAGVALSGDATIDNTGALTIADNAVDGTDISVAGEGAGSVMYHDGTDWVNLGVGTAGQVLSVNAGATAPEWITTSSSLEGLTDTNITGAADGNILVYDNTNSEWDNVAASGDATISNTGVIDLANGAVEASEIADGAVSGGTGGVITDESITADDLATDSVGADEIAANAVGSAEIATNAVGDDEIDYTNVTLSDFTNDLSLTSANIFVGNGSNQAAGVALSGDATIDNTGALTIADNAVDGTDISVAGEGAGSVMYHDGTDWVNLGIGTAGQRLQVNAGATAPEWVTDNALSDTLTDGDIFVGNGSNVATGVTMSGDVTISNTGVTTIGANAIGSAEVSNNTLTADDLATDSVGADEIAANAVGSAEIATNAVGDDEIDYTNVTLSDFTNDLSLTSANIFVGDGSNQAAGVALSGDATISNTGVLTIGANAIGSAEVSNNTLTADDLATDSVGADEIAAGAVGTSELNATGAGNDKRLTTNGTGDMVWVDDNALDNTLTSANIFVGNASNVAAGVAMSGDATINNTGALDLADDAVEASELNADTAGLGITQAVSGALDVNVDDSTIEVETDIVQVKDDGITAAKLNADTAGDGLVQNGGTGALDVNVDDTTIEINADVLQIKDRNVTLNMPVEYPNFTLVADGSANRGTFESDHDATAVRNYYQWSTRRATQQDYDLVVQWPIPDDFQEFQATNPIQFLYQTTDATAGDNEIDVISLSDTAGAAVTLTGSNVDLVNTAWTTHDLNYSGTPTFTAGEYITLTLRLHADNGNVSRLGEMIFNYVAK